ncbi:MAG: cobyrinate a,c-diamide synthase [Corallincola sp.]|nr:cobyrinate a,c-diamide synthase [Corallincola sp.]
MIRRCPALLITAPASGQGKTTITAALAMGYRLRGLRVRLFKTGPDFLDPQLLAAASGGPVDQLDLWLAGEQGCAALLHEAAGDADLILIEGVMGLFDGPASAAHLARRFGLPLLAVIDASQMAQTFAALVTGLACHDPLLQLWGAIANRVASPGHAALLGMAHAPQRFGYLPQCPAAALPERHLGLVDAASIGDLETRLAAALAALHWDFSQLPPTVSFPAITAASVPPWLSGVRVAVAQDAAFCLCYPASLRLLAQLGAELRLFSPLAGDSLPDCDALYLPGGYPELYLQPLAANRPLLAAIQAHHGAGKPLLAECGGLLYLADSLSNSAGEQAALAGLLPGHAHVGAALVAIGYQQAELAEGPVRGHSYHHGQLTTALQPATFGRGADGSSLAEPLYRDGRLLASFIHGYWPATPLTLARLLHPQPETLDAF